MNIVRERQDANYQQLRTAIIKDQRRSKIVTRGSVIASALILASGITAGVGIVTSLSNDELNATGQCVVANPDQPEGYSLIGTTLAPDGHPEGELIPLEDRINTLRDSCAFILKFDEAESAKGKSDSELADALGVYRGPNGSLFAFDFTPDPSLVNQYQLVKLG